MIGRNSVVWGWVLLAALTVGQAVDAQPAGQEAVPASGALPGMAGLPGLGGELPGMGGSGETDNAVNTDVDTRAPAARGSAVPNALMLDADIAGERLVAVGERGIIVYSDDQGVTWQQASVPVRTLLTAVDFADARQGWAVGHDAVILHTADGGESWRLQHYLPALDSPMLDVVALGDGRVLVSAALGLTFRSSDGGESWVESELPMRLGAYLGMPESFDDFTPHWFAIGVGDDSALYLAGERGVIARSADQGGTWQQLESPYNGSFFRGDDSRRRRPGSARYARQRFCLCRQRPILAPARHRHGAFHQCQCPAAGRNPAVVGDGWHAVAQWR